MPMPLPPHGAMIVLCVMVMCDIGVYVVLPLLLTELMAMPSSPVPRTKLFVAVMLLPTELPSETLLRLMPSAQMAVARLFSTRPPVPEAHQPDSLCWFQMWLATQFVP